MSELPQAELHDLVALYALNALEGDEKLTFESHLAHCARCSEELVSMREAAASLAFAVEAPSPPAGLRDRIMEQARAEPSNVVVMPRNRRRMTLTTGVAAAAATIAVGLGIWSVSLSRELDEERAAADVSTTLVPENSRQIALAGAQGVLMVAPDGRTALMACGLDPTPADSAYAAWFIRNGTPRHVGSFEGGGRCTVVPLKAHRPGDSKFAVTLERTQTPARPSSNIVLTAERI